MELLNPLQGPQYASQSVAFTGTAGTVTGWAPGPQGVVIWADSPCYVIVGNNVTATVANGVPIPANTMIPFIVPMNTTGGVFTVSAIQISTGGTLYVTPINRT